jgi:hypothetical protein
LGYRKITISNDQDDEKRQNLYFMVGKKKFRVKKKVSLLLKMANSTGLTMHPGARRL